MKSTSAIRHLILLLGKFLNAPPPPQILNGEAQLITEVSFYFAVFVLLIKLLHPNSNQLKL